MKILSVDTSSKICNINLYEDGKNIMYKEIKEDITHAKKLMTGIEEVLKTTNTKLEDITYFGSIVGPGSFTGIRIGVSTIKAFALALNIDIIPGTSLELLEENAYEEQEVNDGDYILSIIDARNKEVYGSVAKTNDEYTERLNFAGNINDFIEFAKNIIEKESKDERTKEQKNKTNNKTKILVVGNGKKLFEDELKDKLNNFEIIYIKDEEQRGKYLGRLMEKNIDQKVSSEKLMPIYLKPSGIKEKKAKNIESILN